MVKKYRIVFDRKACIGAAACAAVAPEFWVMKDDGKADLIGFTEKDGKQVLEITEDQMTSDGKNVLQLNKDAAEVCPVQVIHVYEILEDGSEKKII